MQQPLPDYTFLCREGSNFAVILRTGVPVPITVRFSDGGATAVLQKNEQYFMVAMITDKRWFEVEAPDYVTGPDLGGGDLMVYGSTTAPTNVFVSYQGVLTHIRPGRSMRFM